MTGPWPSVHLHELADPPLEPDPPGFARAQRLQGFGQRLHLLGDLGRQRPEELLLVGEVQVEGPVRGVGQLDDVVDPRGVVALRCEHRLARVEEPPFRVPAAGA